MIARGALAVVLLASCVGERPPPITNEWYAIEGRSFPGAPHLVGGGETVILDDLAARLSLVTWPELGPVESDVTVDDSFGPTVWVTPREPLADRWYAMRWAGETHPHTHLDGIPLADGSRVWRFHGRYMPELAQLSYEGDTVYLDSFDGLEPFVAVVPPCDTPVAVVVVEQDGASWAVECGAAEGRAALATPDLDPTRPLHLRADGLLTREGLAIVPVDLTIDSVTSLRVELPPARNPPPVPAALCAGVSCE